MTFVEFTSSVQWTNAPSGINIYLQALWHDAKGNWEIAHTIIQDIDTPEGMWIHAYLHRKEGDDSNARYWYGRAGKKFPKVSLDEEWEEIVSCLIADLKI